jgi:5-methylcytosine-specific restriction endonuclease McrA
MPYKDPEKRREYYAANRERLCAYQRDHNRAYLATDRGYARKRASTSRINAICRGAVIDPDFTDAILAQLLLDSDTCAVCHDPVDLHDTIIDHKCAIVFGGQHKRDNVQIICADCNKKKSSAERSLAKKLKRNPVKSDFELTA